MLKSNPVLRFSLLTAAALMCLTLMAAAQTTYTCGGKAAANTMPLSATTLFPAAANAKVIPAAYGFDLQPVPTVAGGSCASDKPFFFSVGAGDGDYKVTVVLGGDKSSTTTLRAESRRLLLLEKTVAAGASDTETFIVNVRVPEIAGLPMSVKLKAREIGALDWDDKLTLEFNGEHPAVRSITIEPVTNVPTVYIAGDSTVVDQDKEPWAAWGQMLPYFMQPTVCITFV